jgi:hypothetical protein
MDKELTPKQQTSEAIRQAETILILTGQHPSIDQVASTIALSALLRKYGKKVTAVISDDIPAGAKFLPTAMIERTLGGLRDFIVQVDLGQAEVDKLKYTIEEGKLNIHITPFSGGFGPRDLGYTYGEYQFDLIIALGVASYSRLDKVYAQNAELLRSIPLANIDFHRINEQYGAINLVEGSAASLAEILIALSESLQNGLIDEQIATTMLTGIMAATDRFTATHTTAKTMTVAAQMLAMGADQQKIVRGLYRDNRDRDRDKRPPQPPAPSRSRNQDSGPRVTTQPAIMQPSQPQPQSERSAQPALPQPAQPARRPEPVSRPQADQPSQPAPQPVSPPASRYDEPELPAAPVARPAPQPVFEPEPQPETKPEPQPAPVPLPPKSANPETNPLEAPMPAARVPQGSTERTGMEELLPPQHIETGRPDAYQPNQFANPLTVTEPEPLINDTSERRPVRPQQAPRPSNPTNNPVFAQRLDEFEY